MKANVPLTRLKGQIIVATPRTRLFGGRSGERPAMVVGVAVLNFEATSALSESPIMTVMP